MTTGGAPTEPEAAAATPIPAIDKNDLQALVDSLAVARQTVPSVRFPLCLPSSAESRETVDAVVSQLDNYLLPRLRRLDAPLLAVVAGATGAGKSTLVNSLVGAPVSAAGVLRPTTRTPVLVCHPDDGSWFTDHQILPAMTRVTGGVEVPRTLCDALSVVCLPAFPPGAGLLDAPDVDSVVTANRVVTGHLLAAADLLIFVTTAARYGDALPWDLLATARQRGTAVALVLNRVPADAGTVVTDHLTTMVAEFGLSGVPLFVFPESRLDEDGLLARPQVAELRDWLSQLAVCAETRSAVVLRAVGGSIDALESALTALAGAADEQVSAAWTLASAVRSACRAAESRVDRAIADGAVFRGEVLARWRELVESGQVARVLRGRVARLAEVVTAAVTRRSGPEERFDAALEVAIVALIKEAAVEAVEQCRAAWRNHPAGTELSVDQVGPVAGRTPDAQVARLFRDWRRAVLDLVGPELGGSEPSAAADPAVLSGVGLLVTTLTFASPSTDPNTTQREVSEVCRKVLFELIGQQTVETLIDLSRDDLLTRVRSLLAEQCSGYQTAIERSDIDQVAGERLRQAANTVMLGRLRAGLPTARSAPVPLAMTGPSPTEGKAR